MMRKIMSMIVNLITAFVIIVSSLYLVSVMQTINNPSHIPSVLGFTPLTVVSGSMSPGIQTGDLVIIKNGSSAIKPGDVITYRLGGVLVTHRVKEIAKNNVQEVFVTQGDANEIPDFEPVDRSQILGRYVMKIPFGGYIKASLRGLPGILILVGLGFIALMSELLSYTTYKVKEAEKSML